jgi:hypothetical protein
MAVLALISTKIQVSTSWTGTSPGSPGTQTISGTLNTGVDHSAYFTSLSVDFTAETLDFTNFASGGWKAFIAGLKDTGFDCTINQDFSSAVDAAYGFGGTYGFGTTFYMDIMPTSSARGATNPSTVLQVINMGYSPVSGPVGALAAAKLMLKPTGLPGRLTS